MTWLIDWWKKRVRLATGEIEFTLLSDEGKQEVWRSDLVSLKIVAEEMELSHGLKTQADGTLAATPVFLQDLSKRYEELGCPRCNSTITRQVWIVTDLRFRKFQIEFRRQLAKVT